MKPRKHLNELEVIVTIVKRLGQPKPPASPIGDDVSYLPAGKGMLVIKSDMLVGKTDVPKGMKVWQAARKSVVMCASDFAAKGVEPCAFLLSLGIPRSMSRREILELAEGFRRARDEYSVEFLGGDTNECDDLVIDCCMFGFSQRVVERGGAKPGDVVVVSGPFGYAAAGLKILLEGFKAEAGFRKRALSSVFMPKARLRLGVALARAGVLSAAIDSSDGLAVSLHEIAEHGGVGVGLHRLPVPRGLEAFARRNESPYQELALYGGEEYEIVATVPEGRLEEAQKVARENGGRLTAIGRVVKEEGVTLSQRGEVVEVERRGWFHLR